jgi:glycosyltransferase involved in cell wall biosynthesis
MGQKQETVSLAWCDNGNVDGLFMLGVTDVLLQSGVKFVSTIRSQGNQIARQRDRLINHWYDSNKADWLLWVDSDVVISPETFRLLWNNKDRLARPMITGVYFTSDNPEEPLMIPLPTLFMFEDDKETDKLISKRIHPLPENKLIKVDAAGMGFILMHRDVVSRVREKMGDVRLFAELGKADSFLGEDIYFFALCHQLGIPLWCHTGALAPHMKRFSFDYHYYKAIFGGNKDGNNTSVAEESRKES